MMKALVAAIVIVSATPAHAEPTADELDALGFEAMTAKKCPLALTYYRQAFKQERTPMRASQVVIASACAQDIDVALGDLWVWLRLKKEFEAKGRSDPSLSQIDNMMAGYDKAVERLNARIKKLEDDKQEQRTTVEKLNETVKSLVVDKSVLETDLKRAKLDLMQLNSDRGAYVTPK